MPDRPGIGHNRPPDVVVTHCRVSCDWVDQGTTAARPKRFQSYWRIYRGGELVDSFMTKAAADRAARALRARYDDA